MIESLMYAALGMLVASLLWLLAMPLIWNRAVRLTMRRIEGLVPVSMAEIQADKDQLRAEFAMSTRRLEMGIEQLRTKSANQLGELSRRAEVIVTQKAELAEKTAVLSDLETRASDLEQKLASTRDELATGAEESRVTAEKLAMTEQHLASLKGELGETAAISDGRKAEISVLAAEVEALKARAASLESLAAAARERLASEHLEAQAVAGALAAERGHAHELEEKLATQSGQAEVLASGIDQLKTAFLHQGDVLARREEELARLTQALTAAREAQAAIRAEADAALTGVDRRVAEHVAEKKLLEGALANAREERGKLQHELAALKHQAGKSWEAERVEDALLRERINDLAAQIAQMAAVYEGPASPINRILDGVPAGDGASGAEGGTLAERIKALQLRASRLGTAN